MLMPQHYQLIDQETLIESSGQRKTRAARMCQPEPEHKHQPEADRKEGGGDSQHDGAAGGDEYQAGSDGGCGSDGSGADVGDGGGGFHAAAGLDSAYRGAERKPGESLSNRLHATPPPPQQ